MVSTVAFAVVVCLSSWLGLAVGAGNVGLQQSLRLDPMAFATAYPLAVGLSLVGAFAAAAVFAARTRKSTEFAVVVAVAVLFGDVLGSFLAAPLLIGELEPSDGGAVLLVVSLLGAQPVAAWAGAWLGARTGRTATTWGKGRHRS
jgi:hypothetical protein